MPGDGLSKRHRNGVTDLARDRSLGPAPCERLGEALDQGRLSVGDRSVLASDGGTVPSQA